MGFLAWQPLRTSRIQDLIHSRWEALPDLILEMIHHQELSGIPFFLIQITPEKSTWVYPIRIKNWILSKFMPVNSHGELFKRRRA
jgi:hypothetical protein